MKLICMSFDGDYQEERPSFNSSDDAWEYSNDLGSKWIFYPFHFVVTESGKTVVEAPDLLSFLNGRRVSTVARIFREHSEKPENEHAGIEAFVCSLLN